MNYTNHTNNTSSSFDIDATIDMMKKMEPHYERVDVFIITREMETLLKEYIPVLKPTPKMLHVLGIDGFDTLCGIPLEAYDTIEEATCRALELKDLGKQVRLITND